MDNKINIQYTCFEWVVNKHKKTSQEFVAATCRRSSSSFSKASCSFIRKLCRSLGHRAVCGDGQGALRLVVTAKRLVPRLPGNVPCLENHLKGTNHPKMLKKKMKPTNPNADTYVEKQRLNTYLSQFPANPFVEHPDLTH